jgi:hypothetical protein
MELIVLDPVSHEADLAVVLGGDDEDGDVLVWTLLRCVVREREGWERPREVCLWAAECGSVEGRDRFSFGESGVVPTGFRACACTFGFYGGLGRGPGLRHCCWEVRRA